MPDLDILTELELDSMIDELLKEPVPCDNDHNTCASHRAEKASWLITHLSSTGRCTRILCDPCVVEVQKWIAQCVVRAGGEFHCLKCHVDFNYKTIIFREI